MVRRVLSLVALGAVAVAATGWAQPPAGEKKAAPKPDADLEAALAHDPDVRLARAKVQLAGAELAKARQAVVARLLTLRATIEDQKRALDTAAQLFAQADQGAKAGHVSRGELLAATDKMLVARSALSRSETELKLMTTTGGAAPGQCPAVGGNTANCTACHKDPFGGEDAKVAQRLDNFRKVMDAARAPAGPIPDRIRAALDKPVKFGAKGTSVKFDAALEEFKKHGLDVPVRVPVKVSPVDSLGEEMPIGAWLQLFADGTDGTLFLVREYGLLVTHKSAGPPPDAVSVFDLWKQKPVAAPKQ